MFIFDSISKIRPGVYLCQKVGFIILAYKQNYFDLFNLFQQLFSSWILQTDHFGQLLSRYH